MLLLNAPAPIPSNLQPEKILAFSLSVHPLETNATTVNPTSVRRAVDPTKNMRFADGEATHCSSRTKPVGNNDKPSSSSSSSSLSLTTVRQSENKGAPTTTKKYTGNASVAIATKDGGQSSSLSCTTSSSATTPQNVVQQGYKGIDHNTELRTVKCAGMEHKTMILYDSLVCRSGACLDLIVKSMYQYPGTDAAMHEWVCASVAKWARNSHHRRVIASSNGFEVVLLAMRRYPDHSTVQEYGCQAIGNLCRESAENSKVAADLDAIRAILEAMKRAASFSQVAAKVHSRGCFALTMSFANESNKGIVLESGGVNIIIGGMRRHGDDAEAQESSCLTLWLLASTHDLNDIAPVRELANALINVSLAAYPKEVTLHRLALSLLSKISSSAEHASLFIETGGGLEAVANAMGMHSSQPTIVEICVTILWRVSYYASIFSLKSNDEDCDQYRCHDLFRIASPATVEALVGSIWSHGRDSIFQENACYLLSVLATDPIAAGMVMAAGGVSAVVGAMMAHTGNMQLQRQACLYLSRLARHDNEQWREQIAESGAIEAILEAMSVHQVDEETQVNASSALFGVSRRRSNASDIFRFEHARRILEEAGGRHTRCRRLVQKIFSQEQSWNKPLLSRGSSRLANALNRSLSWQCAETTGGASSGPNGEETRFPFLSSVSSSSGLRR